MSFFAADNIAADFLENTPDGRNTLHGTIVVTNQNDVTDDDTDSIPVNEPIQIPEYIIPIDVNIDFKLPPTLQPITPAPWLQTNLHTTRTIIPYRNIRQMIKCG